MCFSEVFISRDIRTILEVFDRKAFTELEEALLWDSVKALDRKNRGTALPEARPSIATIHIQVNC